MKKYNSPSQLYIEEFKTPFQMNLKADNRWVQLSNKLPWDKFAGIYLKNLSDQMGRPAVDARVVIGALVIKHKLNLSDRETIATIQENPYMQFFLGLNTFHPEPLFDPSLFVEMRKRMRAESFDKLNEIIIREVSEEEDAKHVAKAGNGEDSDDGSVRVANKGKLQVDATVADQYIKFPTDLDLLNESRQFSERIIDEIHKKLQLTTKKPRTYRRVARKEYLSIARKKNKTVKEIRSAIRGQLQYLRRNFRYIDQMLEVDLAGGKFPLSHRSQRYLWIIKTVYAQQREMYEEKKNTCQHRIVSLHQPHVRPIVRGKQGSRVEFGAKIGLSLDNGFSRINTMSWDAYHESSDLIAQVEAYKSIHGYYPELVQVDQIYVTRENRNYLKERNIRITAKGLGRPKKEDESYYYQRKRRKEFTERNQIEGKFGQGKNAYNMNKIRARLQCTSESWIACIIFVMNLIKYDKEFFYSLFFKLFTVSI